MIFKNSYAKLNRAKDTLDELRLKINQFKNQKGYTLKNEFDKNTSENLLVYYPIEDIPLELPVMIGEVIQHLRSVLDLTVYELTLNENGYELKNSEFPIFYDKDLFLRKKNNGVPANRSGLFKMRGLKKSSQDIIEKIQPYNYNQKETRSILSLIHDLNIMDKHKTLLLCRRVSNKTKLFITRDADNPIHFLIELNANLEEKAIIGRLLLKNPDENHYLDADLDMDLCFDKENHKYFKKSENVLKILESLEKGVLKILKLLEQSL